MHAMSDQNMPLPTLRWRLQAGILAALLSVAIGAPCAPANAPELEALRQEMQALRRQVSALTRRLDALEARPVSVGPPTPAASGDDHRSALPNEPPPPVAASHDGRPASDMGPETALRAAWSHVEPKLDHDAIRRLLGEPTRRVSIDGREAWLYAYPGLGMGSVFFTDLGLVSSRQSPFAWGG
jgi:hypothetical protein